MVNFRLLNLEKGAKIKTKTQNQSTLFQIASMNGKINFVKYIVSKGAYKNAKEKDGNAI